MTDIDGGKSGSISLGDQRLRIYKDVTFTAIGDNSVAPRSVVINTPGLYVISITGSATAENGQFWHGMCVIYRNGSMYYCKALGAMGSGAWAPYIYLANNIYSSDTITLDSSNSVISNTSDWVNSTMLGGGGFRIGARGKPDNLTATVMIFHIG